MSRSLTDQEIAEVINTKDDNITKELFIVWFGRDANTGKSRFQPNDTFMLKPGMIKCFKENMPIRTTIGKFIYNRFLNESLFGDLFPYYNGQDQAEFDRQVIDAFVMKKIDNKLHSTYETKKLWLAYTNMELLVPGLSFDIMSVNPKVEAKKKELAKKYQKELDNGSVVAAKKIEDELLALAREENKNDPAMRLYNPIVGKPSWGNNYKNMCVMIGAQKDNDGDGFKISTASYQDGIPIDEYDSFADQLIGGTYARSVATAKSGYMVKKTQSALQNETCNTDINSDCGSQITDVVDIPVKSARDFLYKFIKEGSKLIELTPDNINQYAGKRVHMRRLTNCKGKSYCAKCAGSYFARLGIKNAGLTCSDAPSTMLNASMKAFHDATIKTYEIVFEDFFKD